MRQLVKSFRHILTFCAPDIAAHFTKMGLGPELFTLSWFMTYFAHVFSLEKVWYILDHVLTGHKFLVLFIAVGIIDQLRDQLLKHDFGQVNLLLMFRC